tara:strand:+ start:1111 stop:1473 length:363 start_codon:yes stop_codon:yes gene_type:complete
MRSTRSLHVAYNDCEGSFALSKDAVVWMAERGVIGAHRLLEDVNSSSSGIFPRVDESLVGLERHDTLLALCVKELGSQRVSGERSLIRLREIKGKKYMIKNVGGIETVFTPEEIIWVEVE